MSLKDKIVMIHSMGGGSPEGTIILSNTLSTDWSSTINYFYNLDEGDRLLVDGKWYINITGSYDEEKPPADDSTNWLLAGVGSYNDDGYLYIIGQDGVENSQRFSIDGDDGVAQIEKYSNGIWNNTEMKISYGTLYLGDNMAIGAAGDQLVTESIDRKNKHLYAKTVFSSSSGTEELRILHLNDVVEHFISQPDDTGEFSNTFLTYVESGFIGNLLSVRLFLKVGNTDATEAISLNIYNGPDNTYTKKFSQKYPPSTFSARSGSISVVNDGGTAKFTPLIATGLWVGMEITHSEFTEATYNGTFEITSIDTDNDNPQWYEISSISYVDDESGNYNTSEFAIDLSDFVDLDQATSNTLEFSSDATFSLKTNSGVTKPWLAGNFYPAYYDQVLITKEWTENDSTTQEDAFISHTDKNIYYANSSQPKGVTFEGDKKYWNPSSPFIFSWEHLPPTQNLLIPENHQMVVKGTFTMEGDVNLQGTLALIA